MDLVLLIGENDPGPVRDLLRAAGEARFRVIAVPCGDWNRDLSPWRAPPAFKKGGDFSGGAEAFLPEVLGALDAAEAALGEAPERRVIAGYSLAGLFALWTLYRTPRFDRAACASPSLWFPGWTDFMAAQPLLPARPRVALSLGDREDKSRNPGLSGVGDAVRGAQSLLLSRGVPCTLRMDRGGHFEDAAGRTARTILEACV